MMLENFFTLVEMKNGITTLARVEELIDTMQQQKNCPINNISDATRQWAKVISTITATKNEDCLKLFVKLKGLTYFNLWVQDVLKFSNENAESTIEDFLSVLLGSLEKLPVVKEDSAASEMQLISEKLVRLEKPNIKERARILFERWTHAMEIDAGCQSLSNNENGKDGNFDAADNGKPIASDVDNLNDSQLDKTTDLLTESSKEGTAANAIAQNMDAPPAAIVPNSSQENLSVTPRYANEELKDASFCKDDCPEDIKMNVDTEQAIPSKPDQKISNVQSPSKLSVTPAAHIPEQSVSCNFDVKEKNSLALKSVISPSRSASMDCVIPKHSSNINLEPDMQCLLPNGGSKLNSDDDSKESPSENMEEVESGSASEVEVGSLEPSEKKSTPRVDHNSDFGLEYGEIDALEVARQVAIEVEREVVDYREPFCNSSPDHSSRENGVGPMCSEHLNVEENAKREADVEQSSKQITQAAISESETNKNKLVFDLNEDICIEESDSMVNLNLNNAVSASLSTPVPVTASKDSPALPVGPLKFEGELGWKGSAATSAFRSTSPKIPDIEKTSSSQKRKAKCIEFDLNVVDRECDPEDLVEVSSKKPEKVKLDLNQLGDEETSQPQVQLNSYWTPASSSSAKQPQARGFDLNNNPIFFDVMGTSKKPEITIMGLKITDRKEDHMSEAPKPFFESGPSMVSPYSQFPVHASSFNGNMIGQPMGFTMPHYTYGTTMPCMIDSRGTPVVPQILSNVGLNTTTQSAMPPHFLMSSNVAGTSQSGLDINSIDGGNINFFMQERNGMTEEQGSMNRKESHSGRELYNFMASWQ